MSETLERLKIVIDHNFRTGQCPFCDRVTTLPYCESEMATSGIWAHIRACHKKRKKGDLFDRFSADMRQVFLEDERRAIERETQQKEAKLAEKKETREAPTRKHVVTGELLMDVVSELESLLDMREPYYKQCPDADDETLALIDKLNGIIATKPSNAEGQS